MSQMFYSKYKIANLLNLSYNFENLDMERCEEWRRCICPHGCKCEVMYSDGAAQVSVPTDFKSLFIFVFVFVFVFVFAFVF